jgi:DNA/RNA-binding domain of Phe-tRNA-synthetase-like protein
MLEVRVDGEVARVLALGVVVLEEIGAAAGDGERAIDEACARARARDAAAREAFRAPARLLYRAFGIDPTKHRPSSEQLAHRVGRGDAFPRVSPLVDAVNVCQLEQGLPYGLYDLDALEPPVVARAGRDGESYAGIRKGEISVAGRPCLADARGPFGNPSSDSDRAKTTERTRRALAVVFGAPDMTGWERVLDETARTFARFVSARVAERRVVRGAP